MKNLLWALLGLILVGCGGSTLVNEKPPCDAATVAFIEASCLADKARLCGDTPGAQCEAFAERRKECHALLDKWESCGDPDAEGAL